MRLIHKVFLFILYGVIIRLAMKVIIGTAFRNTLHLKNIKQCIIIGNHNSHLDTMAIMATVPPRLVGMIHPVAAKDYFGKSWFSVMLGKVFINLRLITRKGGTRKTLDQMDELLKKGRSIIIFPEGSRGMPEEKQKFRAGAAYLVEKNPDIPFIPIYLEGMGKALPKGEAVIVPFTSQIVVGEPVFCHGKSREDILQLMIDRVAHLEKKFGA